MRGARCDDLTGAGPAEPPGASASRRGRDPLLDLLRAVATVRVVTWHASSAPAVTLVAAIPVMFFVTGALFARSVDRHGARATLRDRFRRIAPPLWAFALAAWLAMAVAAANGGGDVVWSRLPAWFLPFGDPTGSDWEAGWLATPLWYLRALLWVFLLAPLALRGLAARPRATLAVGVVATLVLEVTDRARLVEPAWGERLTWQLGDLALYGTFFLVGAHYERRWSGSPAADDPRCRRRLLGLAAAAAMVAGVVAVLVPPPEGIVNNSHVLHLMVGAVWLALAFAGAPLLRRLAGTRPVAAAVGVLSRRSLTVYLWHTAAIALALWWLDRSGRAPVGWWALWYAAAIAGLTAAFVVGAGWLEDLAARRRPELWPRPAVRSARATTPTASPGAATDTRGRSNGPARRLAAGASVLTVALLLVGLAARPLEAGEEVTTFAARVPSQAPPRPVLVAATDAAVPAGPVRTLDAEGLDALLEDWVRDDGVRGVTLAVLRPGSTPLVVSSGVHDDGRPRDPADPVEIQSVTKLFTANLVFRTVDEGLVDLDAPLPALDPIADFPVVGELTTRQLLSHRSGLVNYRDTQLYLADPAAIAGPREAIAASVLDSALAGATATPTSEPVPASEPAPTAAPTAAPTSEPAPAAARAASAGNTATSGSVPQYSSTNFLILGYLLEQVTGRPYDELLRSELLDPLELGAIDHLPSTPGEPRFATSGLVTDVGDLSRAGLALLRDHVGISEQAYAEMTAFDPDAGMGPGTMSYCPCTVDDTGAVHRLAVGYAGGSTILAYLPEADLVVAADLTDGLDGDRFGRAQDLLDRISHLRVPDAP